ncbi:MAG: energy transducer TonB [Saprospiraceae bacterium]|nr:energy transducer TonB [Saprospiraceae bacterium]
MKNITLLLILTTLFSLNQKLYAQEENKDTIIRIIEKPPSFPGGEEARVKFIIENVEYPDLAREKNIQGTVYVSFVVDTDGNVTDVEVLRGIGGGCDEEAVRVIKLMPKWKPGTQRGKAVRVQFNMPIKFTLQSKKKKKRNK